MFCCSRRNTAEAYVIRGRVPGGLYANPTNEQVLIEYILTHMGPRKVMGPYIDWWAWVEQEWWDWVPVCDTYGWRHG